MGGLGIETFEISHLDKFIMLCFQSINESPAYLNQRACLLSMNKCLLTTSLNVSFIECVKKVGCSE